VIMPSPRILFCSLSGKIALYQKVLESARTFDAKAMVVGCDCDDQCCGASMVDSFIQFPRLSDMSTDQLIEICKANQITHILPTRDGELSFWSERKEVLAAHKIETWVSCSSFLNACDDKLSFFKQWEHSPIAAIPTFERPTEGSPIKNWVAKERIGSGSRNALLNIPLDQAEQLSASTNKRYIFQPFIEGKEFTAEIWVSKTNHCHGPVLRWRDKIVDGESHYSTIFRNPSWEDLIKKTFCYIPGARGHCNAQVIVDVIGNLHLIEINPRMGGASPLALHAGLNSICWHLMEEAKQVGQIPLDLIFPEGMSLCKKNGQVFLSS
jgi:carbamoyl-phosphate synthase large subunit